MDPLINVAEHYTNINDVVLTDWLPITGRPFRVRVVIAGEG